MTGKLKTKGNIMLATKLDTVLKVCHLPLTRPLRNDTNRSIYRAQKQTSDPVSTYYLRGGLATSLCPIYPIY